MYYTEYATIQRKPIQIAHSKRKSDLESLKRLGMVYRNSIS